MALLEVQGITKVFGHGHLEVRALDGVSLTVEAGELVALMGPSGSGKTTLLLCISLILEPTSGTVVFDGQTIYRDGATWLDVRRLRREKIGFVFQTANLIPFLTARENVLFPLTLVGTAPKVAAARVMELLEYMEISARADYLPALLSGGEQQRVAIARALANRPQLILADEPTASLDTARGKKVMALLKRIAREHRTAVVTVTHDPRMIEGFDVIYHLKDGRLENSPEST
ncbi:MAG: ABC transporter ATP-binding protein [Syntrophobacterales bacterium]|nr:ABC transporter ATP-binding protein [Syntrophobacterales bacterium]